MHNFESWMGGTPSRDDREARAEKFGYGKRRIVYDPNGSYTSQMKGKQVVLYSPEDIMKNANEDIDFIVQDYLARGSHLDITGAPKAGKTTMALDLVRAIATGGTFAGRQCKKSGVVYLTEQKPATLGPMLKQANLVDVDNVHFVFYHDVRLKPWPELVEDLADKMKAHGAEVLVVDTLPQFVRLMDDSENNAGAALQAVEPLHEITGEGKAVITLRHERKGGGDVISRGRGSGAFAGAADVIMSIVREPGRGRENVRKIEAIGRFPSTPPTLYVERTEDGLIVPRGTSAAVKAEATKDEVQTVLAGADEPMAVDDILKKVEASKATLNRVLSSMEEEGEVLKVGEGKKGDPYKYTLKE